MNILKAVAFVLALAVIILFPMINSAFAQTTDDTTINLGSLLAPWLSTLIAICMSLITAIAGWAIALFQKKTGIEIEAKHMQALQSALTNGAGKVLNEVGDRLSSITFDVRNPTVKSAIVFVNSSVPDAIKYFGLTETKIAEMIINKLGVITAPTTVPSTSP